MEVTASVKSGPFENRDQDLISGSGPRGGFENDQSSGRQVATHRVGGKLDGTQVRSTLLGQRRRHTDDDHVGGGELSLRSRRPKATSHHLRDLGVGHVVDMRMPGIDALHNAGRHVESDATKAGGDSCLSEGQAHIAESNDGEIDSGTGICHSRFLI